MLFDPTSSCATVGSKAGDNIRHPKRYGRVRGLPYRLSTRIKISFSYSLVVMHAAICNDMRVGRWKIKLARDKGRRALFFLRGRASIPTRMPRISIAFFYSRDVSVCVVESYYPTVTFTFATRRDSGVSSEYVYSGDSTSTTAERTLTRAQRRESVAKI